MCFAPNRSAGRKVRGPTVPVQLGDDSIDSNKLDLADAIGDLFDRLLSFFVPTLLCRVGIGLFVAE